MTEAVCGLDFVRGLEERAFNAWPALATLVVDGWVLRFADGFTKRANSINAWQPRAPIESLLDHAGALYASRGLPTIVRVSPLAPPGTDDVLDAAGYRRADETIVMTADLARHALPIDRAVTLRARPDDSWSEGFAGANNVPPARRAIHDRMLAAIPGPVLFASLAEADRTLGWGIAAQERGMVGLFDIITSPDARRRGIARRLIASLLAQTADTGARTAYLQVVATNLAAIALYRSLGFRETYRYHYRIASPERHIETRTK